MALITLTDLPLGLVMDRSAERTIEFGEVRNGMAITHDVLQQNWYASDFYCGVNQDPTPYTATFGPFTTRTEANNNLDPDERTYLAANGTNGVSTWLSLL
jgi:hypothetical protein